MFTILKGLPISYFKDLQDDKEIIFKSYDVLFESLKIFNEILKNVSPNKKRMLELAYSGYITATDLADYLVKNNSMSFRKAYQKTALLVNLAEKKKKNGGTQAHFHDAHDEPTVKLHDQPYSYTEDRKFIVLQDRFAPVIIQAGDQQQYGSFEAFMAATQQAPIALHKTVVPTFNILLFTPPQENAPEMVFNAANNEIPMLDNDYIIYEHPMTFDSPYLKSEYKSGKIQIQYGGETLDLLNAVAVPGCVVEIRHPSVAELGGPGHGGIPSS